MVQSDIDARDMQLLNAFQHDFPLVDRPYEQMGQVLGMSEEEVMDRLRRLSASHAISRVGAVLRTRFGCSTLAAMEVPLEEVEEVAAIINSFPEINHNYEREHRINIWFVVVAENETSLTSVLEKIQNQCHHPVHVMPMVEEYHVNLGFPLH